MLFMFGGCYWTKSFLSVINGRMTVQTSDKSECRDSLWLYFSEITVSQAAEHSDVLKDETATLLIAMLTVSQILILHFQAKHF